MRFLDKLEKMVKKNNSLLCVGLDSDINKIPKQFQNEDSADQFLFNKNIIDKTFDLVCSYKLNIAFYLAIGLTGLENLKLTIDYLKKNYPEIPIIIDAKIGDIGNTNKGYIQFIFDFLKADAVTVNPYLGAEAIGSFLERKDKGVIVLCRTSNPGAGEFQDIKIKIKGENSKLYQYVAGQVIHKWNENKNCLLVIGATYPKELKEVREMVGGDIWFLVPGIGVQGGDLEAVIKAGLNKKRSGLIINASRSIIFSDNPRRAAVLLKEEINRYRYLFSS